MIYRFEKDLSCKFFLSNDTAEVVDDYFSHRIVVFNLQNLFFHFLKFNLIIIISWRYDREEGSTLFDGDNSSLFLGDEASFQKKEAELAKRLVTFRIS